MKKILFVIESLSGGGAEKVLLTIIQNLDRSKFDITILTVVNTGVYIDELKNICRVMYILPNYNNCKLLYKIIYKIKYKLIYNIPINRLYKKYIKEEYDIEIAFIEGFATKFVASSSNLNSKKICWIHIDMEANPYADNYFSSIQEERNVYKLYDKIIGVSLSVKKTFENKFKLPNSVEVIYNPIDSSEIHRKASLEIKVPKNKLQLITIGRLTMQKGYDRLIQILAELEKYKFEYKLQILGEGSERIKLEKMIYAKHLESKIELLGFKENPYPYLQNSDVFICSSRAEGFSLVIAEAMILNKPILSVNCAGPNEILNYGEFGVLVENTDESLKNMIFQLLNKEFDLKNLENLSKKRQVFFNLNKTINHIEDIFSYV